MKAPIQITGPWQLLLRLLFPQHHRKVTTTVVGIGALLLLDGYLLQGLIAWLAQIMLAKFTGATPPTFADASADGSILAGVALIGMALIYSVLVLIIETFEARSLRDDAARKSAEVAIAGQNVLRRDRRLYEDFLTDFRTGGSLEDFVCEHNFGGSWHSNRSNLLDDFVIKWRAPERAYQSPEIGDAFIVLVPHTARSRTSSSRRAWPKAGECPLDPVPGLLTFVAPSRPRFCSAGGRERFPEE